MKLYDHDCKSINWCTCVTQRFLPEKKGSPVIPVLSDSVCVNVCQVLWQHFQTEGLSKVVFIYLFFISCLLSAYTYILITPVLENLFWGFLKLFI